ncbi:MAG: NAD-binding protein, partial [Pseudomonadota bacterium]
MLRGQFDPGGLVTTQLKDMDNALAAAAAAGIDLPLTRQARAAYEELASDLGRGDRDHAAYWLWLRERAGA